MQKQYKLWSYALFMLALLIGVKTQAQPNCTNHTNSNGQTSVTFNVENTNSSAIIITDIQAALYASSGNVDWELLYNTTPVNSGGSTWTQGVVGNGQNGWVLGGSATGVASSSTVATVLSGLTITIPGNTTYGFCLTTNGTLAYQSLSTGTFTFPSNGVNLITGDNVSFGGGVTPGGSGTPSFYPRGIVGCINWMTSVPCSGTPTAGTAVVSPSANVCPNQSFTVSLSGATIAAGLTYDWQYNDGSGWQTTGGTNASYTATMTATAPVDYRCIVYCGSAADTSTPVTVSPNPFYNCYCASSATNSGDGEIFNVTVGPLNNTSTCSQTGTTGSVMNQYSDYTNLGPDTLYHDAPYNLSVQAGSCGGSYDVWVKVYIDLDQDGAFTSTGEEVFSGTTPSGSYNSNGTEYATGSILIPSATFPLTGTTRMRVVMVETNSASSVSPCGTYGYGETEDYLIYVATPPLCTGTPSHATASGPSSICPSTNFTLSASGVAIGVGITYDWQYNDGSGWFTTGITSPFYTVTGGITLPTDYRMVTYCGTSNMYDTSNVVSVAINGFYACYCSPLNGTTLSQYGVWTNFITNVTIPTTNLNNTTTSYNSNGYEQFIPPTASQTDTLWPGVTYTIDVTKGTNYQELGAWIDWDQSGTFDASELISFTFNSNASTVSATFTVPLTATPGMTGLRVRGNDWTVVYSATLGACDNDFEGETEDYVITVGALTNCTGAPNHATATGPSGICANTAFTLGATGMTIGLGISYDWQYNDGSGWQSTGGTSTTYTETGGITVPTDYRMITYCGTSNQYDTSSVVSVAVNGFYACYCSPLNGTTLSQYGVWTNFITNVTIPTTNLNNTTTSYNSNGYEQFIPPTASQTDTLWPGVTYTIDVTKGTNYQELGAWIDWDQSGTFDATELISFTFNSNASNVSATFTVPLTATPGMTGLRVRGNDWTVVYSATLGACDNDFEGETEDYVITVGALTNCTGAPNHATATAPASICANTAFTVTATGMTLGLGITYDWQYNDGSGWQTTGGTNTTYTETAGITVPTDYRMVTYCGTSNQYDTSNVVSVAVNPFYNCYCPSYSEYIYDGEIYNVTISTLNNSSTCLQTGGPGSMINQYSSYTGLTPTPLAQGVQYPVSVTAGACNGYPYSAWVKVWIDLDHDGAFTSPGEEVYSGTTPSTQYTPAGDIATGTIQIPVTAPMGITGMRVTLWQSTTATPVIPCAPGGAASFYYGETEDYLVDIIAAPSCVPPSGLNASNVTAATADLNWTQNSSATQWQIEYGPAPLTLGTGTRVTTSTKPYSISGLNPVTTYQFYVRDICGPADTSMWISATFTTPCAPITSFPWVYDVESQPTNGGSGQMTGCWTASPVPGFTYSWWVSGSGTTPSSGTGPSAANSGTHFFYTEASNGSSGNTATLESPQFDITSLTTPQLQFAYHMYGVSINKLVVEVHNGTGWVPMDSIIGQQQTSSAATWQNKIVPLTGLTGVIQFRLVATRGSSFEGDISIDDIMVMNAPTCPQPSSLTLSNYTSSGVDVSWTGTGSNFILEYGPFGYTPGTGATAGTGGTLVAPATSPYTISGLASGQYSVYVREDCSSASNGYSVNSGNSFWTLPANDSCAGAIAIPAPSGSGSVTYSYNGATHEVLPVTCGSTTSGMYYGLWYTITTGTSTGSVTATLCNSTGITGDTYMRIYDGTCGSFTCVNYSDDYCGALSEVTFTAAASTTYYILVSSYGTTIPTGTFTLDVSGTPLAIKLDKISATNVGKANRIDWNSLDEAKGDKFELQRSADGRNFEAIAYIQAKGAASRYTYMDYAPYNGINYYRLLMKDAGGKAEYSKVVTATVDVKGGFAVNAYPNPVSHDLTVQVSGVQGADATVQVTDVTGKVINTIKMTSNVETINMSSLANGIYLIKYIDADHTQTIRVNKQ